jgi:hypothetical protein
LTLVVYEIKLAENIIMTKENKGLFIVFALCAVLNLLLVIVLWFYCSTMEDMFDYLIDSHFGIATSLVLRLRWWPWIMFSISTLGVALIFFSKIKRLNLLRGAIIILIVDIIALALTILVFCTGTFQTNVRIERLLTLSGLCPAS